jgi:hypothetical protein
MAQTTVSPNNVKLTYRGRAQMPWTGPVAASHYNDAFSRSPDNGAFSRSPDNGAFSRPPAPKAADIARAILRRGGEFAAAAPNKKVRDLRKRGLISARAYGRMKSSGLDRDPDLDAATT